jgi:hypothetical protein
MFWVKWGLREPRQRLNRDSILGTPAKRSQRWLLTRPQRMDVNKKRLKVGSYRLVITAVRYRATATKGLIKNA